MVIIAVFAVLTILVLVAAFFAAKVWHWAHVLIAVALFFSSVGFCFLAAQVIDVRLEYMKKAEDAEARIEPVQELIRAASRGSGKPAVVQRMINSDLAVDEKAAEDPAFRAPGIVNLRHELRLQNRSAGRIWRNAQLNGRPDPRTGEVAVSIEFPEPLGLNQGAILFAFEQGEPNSREPEAGKQYIGEFRVTAVNGQQISLEPVLELDNREADRLDRSQGPWALYETMPLDRHEIFEPFSDAELRRMLPESTVEEYIRHGTKASEDDDQWSVVLCDLQGNPIDPETYEGKPIPYYRRKLRDYAFLFNHLAKERSKLLAKMVSLKEDTKKLEAANVSATKVKQERTVLRGKLKTDLDGVIGDRKAIEAHLAAVEQQLARGEKLLAKVLASNTQLAEQLATRQAAIAGIDIQEQSVPATGAVDVDAL